jgi:hypothetical protein
VLSPLLHAAQGAVEDSIMVLLMMIQFNVELTFGSVGLIDGHFSN